MQIQEKVRVSFDKLLRFSRKTPWVLGVFVFIVGIIFIAPVGEQWEELIGAGFLFSGFSLFVLHYF